MKIKKPKEQRKTPPKYSKPRISVKGNQQEARERRKYLSKPVQTVDRRVIKTAAQQEKYTPQEAEA